MIQGPSGAGNVPYTGVDPLRSEQSVKPAHITQSAGLPQGLDDKHSKDVLVDLSEAPAAPAAFANPSGTEERVRQASGAKLDVVAVMFHAMQQMKETASKDREMSLDAHVATLLASAEKLMDAAGERKDAAVSAAVGAMVGSCVSLLGNALALRIATTGGAEAENYNTTLAKIWQSTSESLSGISSSGGKLAAAHQEYNADMYTAAGKALDALAAMHEKRYQENSDLRSNAVQGQNAVLDFVKAVTQSELDAEKNAARNL